MKKILLLTLMLSTSILLSGCGKEINPNEGGVLDPFAQCMTDKGLKMYGTERCTHCQNQKKLFGTAFSKINFIDCDAQKVQCDVAKIEGFPTRIFNGKQYEGEKSLGELSAITNCALPVITNK